jgi:hypothetical protein
MIVTAAVTLVRKRAGRFSRIDQPLGGLSSDGHGNGEANGQSPSSHYRQISSQ